MNPLVNTDLDTYLRELVDHHLPGKDGQGKDSTPRPKNLRKRSNETAPPTVEEKEKRAEKA